MNAPPFRSMTAPVMKDAQSWTRNVTRAATSSGRPARPIGMAAMLCARRSGGIARDIGVQDNARRDPVDINAERGQLGGQVSDGHQPMHGRLAGGVGSASQAPRPSGDGAQRNDLPAPGGSSSPRRPRSTAAPPHDVDPPEALPSGRVDGVEVARVGDPQGVDEDIDRPELSLHAANRARARPPPPRRRPRGAGRPGPPDHRVDRLAARVSSAATPDPSSPEPADDRPADPACAPGHQRDLSSQPQVQNASLPQSRWPDGGPGGASGAGAE